MHKGRDLGVKMMRSDVLPGEDVQVSTVQIEDDIIVYEISATVGGHTETQRHAIGISGSLPAQKNPQSKEDLQAALDAYRQQVVDNAAWHAAMAEATSEVQ